MFVTDLDGVREKGIQTPCTLITGDCLDVMGMIPSVSVDLTVTSPPYDNLRTYKDSLEWGEHVWKPLIEELFRVTKDGGVVVWVVGDATIKGSETGTSFRQALWAKECGFNLHDTMIYKKESKPMTHNRYEQHFEYMFVWSKGKPNTFNPIKDKPNKRAGETVTGTWRSTNSELVRMSGHNKKVVAQFGMRGNIFEYDVGKWKVTKDAEAYRHPAIFPEKLAHDHIISWSNEGDTVLDPFMGSGTTGKMSLLLNRNFIGIEKVSEYTEIAETRIKQAYEEQR